MNGFELKKFEIKPISRIEIAMGDGKSDREENIADGSKDNTRRGDKRDTSGTLSDPPIDLDYVLVNELGQFGRFQLKNILLVAVPIAMSAFHSDYIFSAAAVPHRCRISECGENGKDVVFEPKWILDAIPKSAAGLSSCERYASLGTGTLDYCPAHIFNQTARTDCDGFVYGRNNSVVYDFDLGCQEWLRALAGTLSSVGTLLVLLFIGYVSDKFGRRVALVISVFNLALIGLIKALSVNYSMYLVLQILQTTLGGGTVSSAFIFATETVGPKYRVVTGATCAAMYAVGQVVLGAVAWLVQPWRLMLFVLYIPCFIVIFYYWILSESVRWLLSKKKYDKVKKVLETVAKTNGKEISNKSLQALLNSPKQDCQEAGDDGLVKTVFKSRVLLRRVCTTPIWWITATFVYYGLSINSSSLSNTIYLNFILVCAIEIPGFYLSVFVLDRFGRKSTLFCGYTFSATCNIVFAFVPNELKVLRLVLFLFGKFGISVVFTALYLFTSELYPTEYRHSLLGFSSMIGRIGSISAPLTPVLVKYWKGIPSMMFGVMGFLAAILVLTQPETLGTKLPDTLAEAEALGTSTSFVKRTDRNESNR